MITKKNAIIVVLATIGFFLCANQVIFKCMEEDCSVDEIVAPPTAVSVDESALDQNKKNLTSKKHALVPEDPAKYGIITMEEEAIPQSQIHWDVYMRNIITESKILETEEGHQAIEKMKTSAEEYQKRMDKVDKRIAFFEEQRLAHPNDEGVEKRLQKLYKIKAFGKVLQDKVTTLQHPASHDEESDSSSVLEP